MRVRRCSVARHGRQRMRNRPRATGKVRAISAALVASVVAIPAAIALTSAGIAFGLSSPTHRSMHERSDHPEFRQLVAPVTDPLAEAAVADHLAAIDRATFCSLSIDSRRGSITAYWAGQVPDQARRYAASHPRGVVLRLKVGDFSRSELTAAAQRISASAIGRTIHVDVIGASWDASGLDVSVASAQPSAQQQGEVAAVAQLPQQAITYHPHVVLDSRPAQVHH